MTTLMTTMWRMKLARQMLLFRGMESTLLDRTMSMPQCQPRMD